MKKHRFRKIITVLTAIAMVFAMNATAFADYGAGVAGGTTTLNKYLVIDADASVPAIPANTFKFSVAAGSGNATLGDGELPVTAGVAPGSVTVTHAAFTSGQAATNENAKKALGDSTTTKKAAVQPVTVDFSGVAFRAPGVFRYVITEGNTTAPYSKVANKDKITVDVYVENDPAATATNGLKITKYAAYRGEVTANPKKVGGDAGNAGEKADFFSNQLATCDLKVTKDIQGNQANLDDKFGFTIKLYGVGSGNEVNVKSSTGEGAATKYVADASGDVTITVTLGDDKYIELTGIPAGVEYTIEETQANQNGYVTTGEIKNKKVLSSNTEETVLNTKQGNIPTGIITKMLPALALIAIAALLLARRRSSASR